MRTVMAVVLAALVGACSIYVGDGAGPDAGTDAQTQATCEQAFDGDRIAFANCMLCENACDGGTEPACRDNCMKCQDACRGGPDDGCVRCCSDLDSEAPACDALGSL